MNKITNNSPCANCAQANLHTLQRKGAQGIQSKYVIALAGNPNTGKSTVFNSLTGLKQHTGNWPGKTVGKAEGFFVYQDDAYRIVDLPGTYSLSSTSEDEEIARDFILFGNPDVTVMVADATRLERNMNMILQVLQITNKAVLCVNLLDEAKRNKIEVNLNALSRRLGIPVVGASARSGQGIDQLLAMTRAVVKGEYVCKPHRSINLPTQTSALIQELSDKVKETFPDIHNAEWIAFRLIEGDVSVQERFSNAELNALAERIHLQIGNNFHDQWKISMHKPKKYAEKWCNKVTNGVDFHSISSSTAF